MIAMRDLFRNKVRSLLTILGASVGVAMFVSLTSVSKGFKTQIYDTIENYNIDITVQSRSAPTPFSSRMSISDYNKLCNIEGVKNVSSLIIGAIKSRWNPYLLIIGISSTETLASKVGILEGRMLTTGQKEIILGERVSRAMNYHVNNKILFSEQEVFTIAGIYASGSKMIDGAAVLDINDAKKILKKDDFINMALIHVKNGNDPKEVTERINKRFPGLSAMRSGDFIGQIRLIEAVDVFAWAVSIDVAICF